MAPATRTQAVINEKGDYKTFKVMNITDKVVDSLDMGAEERKALKDKIYGTAAKAEEAKPTPAEPPKSEEPKPTKK